MHPALQMGLCIGGADHPGEYMPVIEEDGFTFLYNSKDMCFSLFSAA